MLFLQTRNETEDRLRDCASWLPLAAGASSRNLGHAFLRDSVQQPHSLDFDESMVDGGGGGVELIVKKI